MSQILITSPLKGLRKNFPSAWRSCILLSALAFYLGLIYTLLPQSIPASLSLLAPIQTELEVAFMIVGAAGGAAYLFDPQFGYSWLIGALYAQWVMYGVLASAAMYAGISSGGAGLAGAVVYLVLALWSLDTAVDVTKLRSILLGTKSGPSRNRTMAFGTSRRRSSN